MCIQEGTIDVFSEMGHRWVQTHTQAMVETQIYHLLNFYVIKTRNLEHCVFVYSIFENVQH